ncbi:MAG: hypothetical protein U1D66_06665 [Erythrobacter sp.]|nr:hypothetical protein [Erythrobacter sp.]
MDLQAALILLYALVASWAMLMTYTEQRAKGHQDLVHNVAGFAACTVWPVIMLFILMIRGRR